MKTEVSSFLDDQREPADTAAATPLQPATADALDPPSLAPIPALSREASPTAASTDITVNQERATAFGPRSPLPLCAMFNTDRDCLDQLGKCNLPCFMIPQPRNPDFVGRAEILDEIDQYLRPPPNSDQTNEARLFALCGTGGIGKTDLAIEYAYSRRDKFDAVFWLEAGGMPQLASDFGRIPAQLGLQTPEEAESLESSIQIAKSWFVNSGSTTPGGSCRWLLIFDNADDLDVVADYIPYGGSGAILVTSRYPFAEDQFSLGGSGIDLEPLSSADGAALLQKLIAGEGGNQSCDEDDAAVELATRLDGLPFAMAQVAAVIRQEHLSIRDFMSEYSVIPQYEKMHDIRSPLQQRYDNTLATAYSRQKLSAKATRLLHILAFLNPDRVQERIFTGANVSPTLGKSWTSSTFEDVRYELLTSLMVKRNISRKELWIQRLLQSEVRARMDESRRNQTFKDAVALLSNVWPPGDHASQKVQRWRLCEDLLPHLERLYQLFIQYSKAGTTFDVDPAFLTLLNEAATFLHERGFSQEGKVYLSLALSLCKQANITTEPLVSDMHLCMGALAIETNDAATCLHHNTLFLAIRYGEAVRGRAPDLRLAFAHSQAGIALMMIEKIDLATTSFEDSVEILKLIDADPDDYGFPVCNLGLAYWFQERLDDAEKILTDLLNQRERLHGKLDAVSYKTGRVLQALGNVKASKAGRLQAQGDEATAAEFWAESFRLHQDCLRQYESTVGRFNHRTADACHKLAEHSILQGKDDLAQSYLDRALRIWGDRQHYRNESARSSFLRGKHLISIGGEENVENGNRWVERAMQLRRAILPEEEPRELTTVDFDELVIFWSV